MANITDWYPCGLLSAQSRNSYGIVILNQPLNNNALKAVIKQASVVVCADAGADRYYNVGKKDGSEEFKRLPDAIVGDLDSISLDVKRYYEKTGVKIIKDSDQYATDFTKSLRWLRQWCQDRGDPQQTLDVVVLGGLGGRVDQGFSQIHHLYMAEANTQLLQGRIYLLSEQSLSFILANGKNQIHLETGYFQESIGIIPVLGPSRITTQGLEWDVEDWPTEFGGQVSTSNHIRSDLVVVTSQQKPLVTIELETHLLLS